MTKEMAIKKSIEHWERMIKWAEKQTVSFLSDKMYRSLGEDWYSDGCPLCKKYYKEDGNTYKESCGYCPLYLHVGKACNEKNHVWAKFTLLLTKDKWINNAKKMLELLEELL